MTPPRRATPDPTLLALVDDARGVQVSLAEREQQARSFAYGNAHLENPSVTRDMVDRAAQQPTRPPSG